MLKLTDLIRENAQNLSKNEFSSQWPLNEVKNRKFAIYHRDTMELASRGLSSYEASHLLYKARLAKDLELIYDDEIKSVKVDASTGKAYITIK